MKRLIFLLLFLAPLFVLGQSTSPRGWANKPADNTGRTLQFEEQTGTYPGNNGAFAITPKTNQLFYNLTAPDTISAADTVNVNLTVTSSNAYDEIIFFLVNEDAGSTMRVVFGTSITGTTVVVGTTSTEVRHFYFVPADSVFYEVE